MKVLAWSLGLSAAIAACAAFSCGGSGDQTCNLSCGDKSGSGGGASGVGSGNGNGTGSGMDPADCASCVDVVGAKASGQPAPSPVCHYNGPPSSSTLETAFEQCACGVCATDCGDNYCENAAFSQDCQTCITNSCSDQLQACAADPGNATGAGGASASSSTGSGSTGSGGSCATCGDYLGGSPAELCPGSQPYYDDLFFCVCEGTCSSVCSDSICVGGDPSADCSNCVLDVNGCYDEYQACANDI